MEEQAESTVAIEMPRTVRIAVNIYWILLILTLPIMIFVLPHKLQAIEEQQSNIGNVATTVNAMMMILSVVSFVIYAFIVWKLASGKNWARILLLLLGLWGAYLFFKGLLHPVIHLPWMWSVPGAIVTLMQTMALILLFLPASGEWFRKRRAS